MKYNQVIKILKEHNLLISADPCDKDFSYISYDSNDIKEDTLFICKGFSFKRNYLDEAIKNGVVCYISETDLGVNIPRIIVNNSRKALAIISLNWYPDNMYKIGITGTKGKTTTNFFIHNILKHFLGYKPGILATQYFYNGEEEGENHITTPESLDLHKHLQIMDKHNLKYMSMEVSSQATKLDRVYGMHYPIGCFLNIGEDHISPIEHEDFADYLKCKIDFLRLCDKVIIFKDTDHYEEIVNEIKDKEIITYGITSDCDYYIKDIEATDEQIDFNVLHNGKEESYFITMNGTFNVLNATCAIIISELLNVDKVSIQKGLKETKVEGRMEITCDDVGPVIVDYAHNRISADALYKSIKETYAGRRIVAVFGCPGKRGMHRRRDMGTSAGTYADYIYLTEDDGGGKDVEEICNDIAGFIKPFNKPYEIVLDRKTAILKALKERQQGDVLAILGKGSEVYQMALVGYDKYQGDMPIVKEYIAKKKKETQNV